MCACYPSTVVTSCPYAVMYTRCGVYAATYIREYYAQDIYNLYILVVCLRILSYKKKCIPC